MAKSRNVYFSVFIAVTLFGATCVDIVLRREYHKPAGIIEIIASPRFIPKEVKESEPVQVITIEDSYLDSRELLTKVFTSYIGVLEIGGNNRGPEVETFLASVGLGPSYPWCAAFVAYCFNMSNIPHTMNAFSPTCCPKDKTYYTKQGRRISLPSQAEVKPGDVFGLYYDNLGRIGHTGFVLEWKDGNDYCVTVEGNTRSSDGSRDGDGVVKMRRRKSAMYKLANWVDYEGAI